MAKIALFSIVSMNYGNRLQNYALSKTITKLGYEVETIRRYPQKNKRFNSFRLGVRSFIIKDKFTNFYLFNKNIMWSDLFINQNEFSENIERKYDAFVVGSDQVWNLTFDFINENYFLPFVKNKRKISYAASFGVDRFENSLYIKAQSLNEFSDISVREETGVGITKQITGRVPVVLVDPTMLLTKEEWIEVSRKPRGLNTNEKYVFLYFLGSISDKQMELIDATAKRYNLAIYSMHGDCPDLSSCGPSEFVYLISHASMVLTDSFHACVFSILFQRSFAVFKRESQDVDMSSRILTLLRLFHLEDRYITELENALSFDYLSCSFEDSESILINERKRSEDYLKRALRGV